MIVFIYLIELFLQVLLLQSQDWGLFAGLEKILFEPIDL